MTEPGLIMPQLSFLGTEAGPGPEAVAFARDFMADRLRSARGVFQSVFAPGGEPFYQRNGLLYLDERELAVEVAR